MMNTVFKALADPTRREILRLLTRGEQTAGDLAGHFDMGKPTISHHFNVLKEAGLIHSRREGQQIYYGLNTTVVQDVMAWALDLLKVQEVVNEPSAHHFEENRKRDRTETEEESQR